MANEKTERIKMQVFRLLNEYGRLNFADLRDKTLELNPDLEKCQFAKGFNHFKNSLHLIRDAAGAYKLSKSGEQFVSNLGEPEIAAAVNQSAEVIPMTKEDDEGRCETEPAKDRLIIEIEFTDTDPEIDAMFGITQIMELFISQGLTPRAINRIHAWFSERYKT